MNENQAKTKKESIVFVCPTTEAKQLCQQITMFLNKKKDSILLQVQEQDVFVFLQKTRKNGEKGKVKAVFRFPLVYMEKVGVEKENGPFSFLLPFDVFEKQVLPTEKKETKKGKRTKKYAVCFLEKEEETFFSSDAIFLEKEGDWEEQIAAIQNEKRKKEKITAISFRSVPFSAVPSNQNIQPISVSEMEICLETSEYVQKAYKEWKKKGYIRKHEQVMKIEDSQLIFYTPVCLGKQVVSSFPKETLWFHEEDIWSIAKWITGQKEKEAIVQWVEKRKKTWKKEKEHFEETLEETFEETKEETLWIIGNEKVRIYAFDEGRKKISLNFSPVSTTIEEMQVIGDLTKGKLEEKGLKEKTEHETEEKAWREKIKIPSDITTEHLPFFLFTECLRKEKNVQWVYVSEREQELVWSIFLETEKVETEKEENEEEKQPFHLSFVMPILESNTTKNREYFMILGRQETLFLFEQWKKAFEKEKEASVVRIEKRAMKFQQGVAGCLRFHFEKNIFLCSNIEEPDFEKEWKEAREEKGIR